MQIRRALCGLCALCVIVSACTAETPIPTPAPTATNGASRTTPTPGPSPTPGPTAVPAPEAVDYQAVKPYEVGHTMVIMYHGIVNERKPADYYQRTKAEFREDLQALYDRGYRLISMRDLFMNYTSDPLFIICWSNIFNRMERCTDACENVADMMGTIVLKNT